MSLNPDEVKEAMKKATNVLWSIRESFGLPVLRKPLIQFAEQLRSSRQISPEQIEALERENIQQPVEEEPRRYQEPETIQRQPIRRQIVRRPATLEIPRVPLPKMIEERITQRRFLPIRGSVARVLDSYSQYISTSPKRKVEEDYEPYDTTRHSIPNEIRQRKALKPHSSIEM